MTFINKNSEENTETIEHIKKMNMCNGIRISITDTDKDNAMLVHIIN